MLYLPHEEYELTGVDYCIKVFSRPNNSHTYLAERSSEVVMCGNLNTFSNNGVMYFIGGITRQAGLLLTESQSLFVRKKSAVSHQ